MIKGVLISLFSGWIPASLLLGLLYWIDRYEKEPAGLLVAAFLWGAIPSLLIAVIARLFFQLPPELLGTNAVDLIWSGLAGPFIEEVLKGIVLIIVANDH